jgi:hypothetical protein
MGSVADAPTPLPRRPTEAEREHVARLLRAGTVDGRLSTDTFAERIGRALGARNRAELDSLVADMRSPGPLRRVLLRAVGWASGLSADLEAAWRDPRLPALALPDESMTIGRAPSCDCVLAVATVSRRHAQVRRDGTRWLLRDLGSRNGTRLNGMRVTDEVEVRPGDQLSLGGVRHRLRAR